MNNDMKCPFCQQAIMCMDTQEMADEHSTWYCPWYCPRCIAEKAWYAFGNKTLWQELIRTRKALDVAVDALREIHLPKQWCPVFAEQEIAKKALDQITALEQKDVK